MHYIFAFIMMIMPFIGLASNYSIGDTLHVVAINSLILRSNPEPEASKLELLLPESKVVVLEITNKKDTIFGFHGQWVIVLSENLEIGYVFDAFISTLPIAKPVPIPINFIDNKQLEYFQILTKLPTDYAHQNFTRSCAFDYTNYISGESHHSMNSQMFEEGHVIIQHTYWEGSAVELKLHNVRLSELFYLVHQFLSDTNEQLISINDYDLRNPRTYRHWKSCAAELNGNGCGIKLYKDSSNAYTLIFIFPCC